MCCGDGSESAAAVASNPEDPEAGDGTRTAPPRVKRCKVHQIVDCFDCKNPVQSTQENPEFDCVEVPNGHE